jgi:hypothetical protein
MVASVERRGKRPWRRKNGFCIVLLKPGPEATIAKIGGLLKPGARLAVGFHEKFDMQDSNLSRNVCRFYSPRDMEALLATCGAFKTIETISRKGKTKDPYCAFGTK